MLLDQVNEKVLDSYTPVSPKVLQDVVPGGARARQDTDVEVVSSHDGTSVIRRQFLKQLVGGPNVCYTSKPNQ